MTALTPAQCRSGRAWLQWSQAELAERAKVGLSTVKDFENGKRAPIQATLAAMKAVLEGGGIAFFDDGNTLGVTGPRL
jgi:DNA-binding transcriptional regulator YiaG